LRRAGPLSPGSHRQDSFVFEITQHCNHRCLHCYNVWKNAGEYPQGELDTADTLKILERMLDQTGAGLVTLSGGEPLLRSDVFQVVSFLNARDVAVNLITNGTLLDDAAIARLADRVSIFELPLLSVEELDAACEAACATEYIAKMDQGYETIVGERGMGLSGGQKQRAAIARALCYRPRILVFDDAPLPSPTTASA
jgi:organic radical activating enzyme